MNTRCGFVNVEICCGLNGCLHRLEMVNVFLGIQRYIASSAHVLYCQKHNATMSCDRFVLCGWRTLTGQAVVDSGFTRAMKDI